MNILKIIRDVIDIFLVTLVFYRFLVLIKDSRAIQVLRGLFILLIITLAAEIFHLNVLTWLLKGFWTIWVVALVIVFQPELRNILAEVGRKAPLTGRLFKWGMLDELLSAVKDLSGKKIGALIALERDTALGEYIEKAVKVDSPVSAQILETVFTPLTPLHDGAVVIRHGKIAAASCIFPLSKREDIDISFGTRHRAALGLTEVSDALVIVVSEETGTISFFVEGKVQENINLENLKQMLNEFYSRSLEKRPAILTRKISFSTQIFKYNSGLKILSFFLALLLWYVIKFRMVK